MRFLDIAMFLIILQLVSTWFVTVAPSMGFSETVGFHEPTIEELEIAEARFQQTATASEEVASEDWVTKLLGFISENIKSALSSVLNPFRKYVLSFPYMLIMIGPQNSPEWAAFVWMISIPMYTIMVLGIIQFATGRSFKEME